MKINLKLIAKMVEAGASGGVVLAYLEAIEAKRALGRPKDRARKQSDATRKRAEKNGKARTPPESVSRDATLVDTPRARLFREGKGALLTLGINDSRAGALITQWLKLTHDDDQLVTAAVLKAQELAVVDAPGWILATLKGKTDGKRTGTQNGAHRSGGADFFAGLAEVAADINGHGAVAGDADAPLPVGRVNIDG